MLREVRLETILGAGLRGVNGELIGRIRDVSAEWSEDAWIVRGLVLEPALARLRALLPSRSLRRIVVPWNVVDWTDPRRPRLRVGIDFLEGLL